MAANRFAQSMSQISSERFGVRYLCISESTPSIDFQELGISMQGLANILNGVFNLYFTAQVRKNPKWHSVRTVALRPESNWSTMEFTAVLDEDDFPGTARQLCKYAGFFMPSLIQASILTRLKCFDAVDRHVEKFLASAAEWPAPVRDLHGGLLLWKSILLNRIDTMTGLLGPSFINLVQPIGKSCRELQIGSPRDEIAPIVIGEAEAIVIRAHDGLKLVDYSEHCGSIVNYDVRERTFNFCESDCTAVISCKIPASRDDKHMPFYESLRDSSRTIRISGRAVRSTTKVVKLFVQEYCLEDGRRQRI
jgi:hypothetical protein